jgi:hypothetical protein
LVVDDDSLEGLLDYCVVPRCETPHEQFFPDLVQIPDDATSTNDIFGPISLFDGQLSLELGEESLSCLESTPTLSGDSNQGREASPETLVFEGIDPMLLVNGYSSLAPEVSYEPSLAEWDMPTSSNAESSFDSSQSSLRPYHLSDTPASKRKCPDDEPDQQTKRPKTTQQILCLWESCGQSFELSEVR